MKKFKLFTTIASLCLAVALMAFGVYAATNIGFSVSGSISFGASEISGDWYLTVSYNANCVVTGDNAYATEQKVTADDALTLNNVKVKDGETSCTITLTARFNNTSDRAATLTAEKDSTTAAAVIVVDGATGEAAAEGEATLTVTITYTAADNTAKDDGSAYKVNFKAVPKATNA